MQGFIKKNLIAGLLVAIPIVLTIFILSFVINKLDQWMAPMIAWIIRRMELPLPEDFYLPGLGFGLVCIFIFFAGLLGTNFFGKKIVQAGDDLLNKIPFVRGFYATIKKVMDTISQAGTSSFKELVLVEYPRPSLYMLGLVAGDTREEVATKTGGDTINVFLPLLPNVTLGFYVVVSRDQVKPVSMDVETGLKFLMSFGIVDTPSEQKKD